MINPLFQPAMPSTGLRKPYADKTVCDGADPHVPTGTTFSPPGPNVAGKAAARSRTFARDIGRTEPSPGSSTRPAGTRDRAASRVRPS